MSRTRIPLDIRDDMPRDMKRYISEYGFHFTKRAYLYAADKMRKYNAATGKLEKVEPYTKEQVDEILVKYGVKVENSEMYDYVYIAQMCRMDYLKSSVPDEQHLALFVKDTCGDPDASSETPFRRWMATMVGNGTPIDWSDLV